MPAQAIRHILVPMLRGGFRLLPALALAVCLDARGDSPPARVETLPAALTDGWEIAFGDPVGGAAGLDALRFAPVKVESTWQGQGFPQHGIAWYRVRFVLSPESSGPPLAFACDQIRDADELYLDGLLVGSTGAFPPAYEKATLLGRVYELPAALTARGGVHELALRVYNAGPRGGGLTGTPTLDRVSAALWRRTTRDAPRALLAAAIGALGLFSLFFYVRDRRQRDSLLFFLFTSAFAVYMTTWLTAWTRSDVSLSLLFRINVACVFGLVLVFVLFFHSFFERPLLRRHKALLALYSAGTAFSLLWPRVDDLYYALPVGYLLLGVGGADILMALVHDARNHLPHTREVLAGTLLLFAGLLHDIAQDLGLFGDPTGQARLVGPTFLIFAMLFLSVVADRVKRLRVAATTDPLTGLPNRSVLFERLALEMARARRHKHPVSLGVLDLDHFKRFNDSFGHVAGDRLLIGIAQAQLDSIRDTDLASRYGGEEFVVLLPEAGIAEALVVFERIRQAVREVKVGSKGGATVSIGVAVYDPTVREGISATALLRQADAALYDAKARGRDRIVVAQGTPPPSSSSGSAPVLDKLVRRRTDPRGVPIKTPAKGT